ncbi:MAG: hypothetical protein ACTSU5_04455, partial [Promethearchaeota archaeon]
NVVLFGEPPHRSAWYESVSQSQKSDVFIVCGSSLEVAPVNGLPVYALNHGSKLVIINEQPTYFDEKAEVVFHEPLGLVLPHLYDKIHELENAGVQNSGEGAHPESADAETAEGDS